MRWRRWAAGIGVTSFSVIGLVGALHLPVARPLLMQLAAVAGCPIAKVTPAQIEQAQQGALIKLRGATAAPAQPALGFTLEKTTLPEVRSWARDHGVRCEESRESTLVKCEGVPADAVAEAAGRPIDEVAFGFRLADHVLVNITTIESGIAVAEAAARLDAVASRLQRQLGTPAATRLPDAAWDGSHPAFVSYRFSDYLAEASAMRLPERGVMFREHYVSARTTAPADLTRHSNGSF